MKKKDHIIKELNKILAKFNTEKKKSQVGVSIEPATIAALEVSKGRKTLKIERILASSLPPDLVVNDDLPNPEALAKEIMHYKKSAALGNTLIFAAPSSMVATKKVAIDAHFLNNEMQKEEFAKAEAKKAFPASLEELFLDFAVLNKHLNNESDEKNLLLIAARKQDLQSRIDVYTNAGFEIKAIDVDYYALERAYRLFFSPISKEESNEDTEEHTAIINISTSAMLLVIMQNKDMVYCHRQGYNGSSLSDLVKKYFCISETDHSSGEGTNVNQSESPLSHEQSELLIGQLQRLLQFYFSAVKNANVTNLILSGRCAIIPGIKEIVETRLSLPTTLANPFTHIEFADSINRSAAERIAPAFALCLGLASHGL